MPGPQPEILQLEYLELDAQADLGYVRERHDGAWTQRKFDLREQTERARFGLYLLGLAVELMGSQHAADALVTPSLSVEATEISEN